MLIRTLMVAMMSVMLLTCSTKAAQNQSITRIEPTLSPVCPHVSSTHVRQTANIWMNFAASSVPHVFALHFSRGWVTRPGIPSHLQLPQSAIRVALQNTGSAVIPNPISELGRSGLPSALEQYCRPDDGGVTYLYGIDEDRLAKGFYNIAVSAPRNVHVHTRNIPMYVAPKPNALPSLRTGQKCLVLPPPSDAGVKEMRIKYEDRAHGEIPFHNISLHVARIVSIGNTTVTLAVSQTHYRLRESRSGNSPALLGLVPILEDPAQQAMESRYAGKRVWIRGDLQNFCASEPGLDIDWPTRTARIQHIYRVDVPFFELALGHHIGASGFGRDSGFETSSPLLVTFAPAKEEAGRAHCADRFSFFADAWDLQRALSINSVSKAHPNWPAAMVDAIKHGKVHIGMTHEMVAWALGFPPYRRPLGELYRLSNWTYDDQPANNTYVEFGADGKVRHFGRTNP